MPTSFIVPRSPVRPSVADDPAGRQPRLMRSALVLQPSSSRSAPREAGFSTSPSASRMSASIAAATPYRAHRPGKVSFSAVSQRSSRGTRSPSERQNEVKPSARPVRAIAGCWRCWSESVDGRLADRRHRHASVDVFLRCRRIGHEIALRVGRRALSRAASPRSAGQNAVAAAISLNAAGDREAFFAPVFETPCCAYRASRRRAVRRCPSPASRRSPPARKAVPPARRHVCRGGFQPERRTRGGRSRDRVR